MRWTIERFKPEHLPDVILVLGTDAAGKDHVATILLEMINDGGGEAEKRKRFLAGAATVEVSSENKGWTDTFLEKLFLALYPYLSFLLPRLVHLATRYDSRRFRKPDKKLVVVGHNGLRGLAFHLGNNSEPSGTLTLPGYLDTTLREIKKSTGVCTIVLDVEDTIRQKRIQQRMAAGSEDNFDRYMSADGQRSERIEAWLVELAQTYLDPVLIENNDLSHDELKEQILRGFNGTWPGGDEQVGSSVNR